MLSTSNVAVQFGAKPLFEQVTVKFSDGNRYGLIGANGCGKSTLMKVLGGDLEPSAGDVMLQTGLRLGKLNQNQFGYEDERVLDVVMQGHAELWRAMTERDRIYANPEGERRGLHAGRRARGGVRRVRRLRRRGARRQHSHRRRHPRVAPQRPDARGAAGLEAARAARAGAVLAARRAAAR